MNVPIRWEDKAIGAIGFRSLDEDRYSEKDAELAERITAQIAGAMANSQLHAVVDREAYDRGERIKELTCMYGVLRLIQAHGDMEDIARAVVAILPPGWQYPEITVARIKFDGAEYVAGEFAQTQWRLAADIVIEGVKRGEIEVCYLEERPEADEGPFLAEERDLIDGIARSLSEAAERALLAKRDRARQAETMRPGGSPR